MSAADITFSAWDDSYQFGDNRNNENKKWTNRGEDGRVATRGFNVKDSVQRAYPISKESETSFCTVSEDGGERMIPIKEEDQPN